MGDSVLLMSGMKNEGTTCLEWYAHHRALGITSFLIYTNDCEDGTDLIWQRLQAMGLAQHRDNPARRRHPGIKPQARMVGLAPSDPFYQAHDWILFLDADEFLNVHFGDKKITALIERAKGADCMFIQWRLFGSGGREAVAPGLVTQNYVHGAIAQHHPGKRAVFPKALFRRTSFPMPGIHRPRAPLDPGETRYIAPSGEDVGRDWNGLLSGVDYERAQVNHYSVRSVDCLLIKFARGFGTGPQPEARRYMRLRDLNHEKDLSIQRYSTEVRAILDGLLQDSELRALQDQAEAWRAEKVAALRADPANQSLIAQLNAMSRALAPKP